MAQSSKDPFVDATTPARRPGDDACSKPGGDNRRRGGTRADAAKFGRQHSQPTREEKIDESGRESFPASDPPAVP